MPIKSGVTIIRGPNKVVPELAVEKIHAENKTGIGLATINAKDKFIVLRKTVGGTSIEDTKKLLAHESLKSRAIAVHFSNRTDNLTVDDLQPFPVLYNAEKKPIVVAFMNGDFSQFIRQDATDSPEKLCLTARDGIITRVSKAFKLADNDLAKLAAELKDDTYAKDFANMMQGSEGSIVLMTVEGDFVTFLVEGESSSAEFPDYWVSHNYLVPAASAEPVDDLAAELGDDPAPAPAKKPVVAPMADPAPSSPSPGKDGKPVIAATSTVVPIAKSGGGNTPSATSSKGDLKVDLGDPETKLTIKVPPNMAVKQLVKWVATRMPENFEMPKVISGLTSLTCTRGQANAKFLETFAQQNKMNGLERLDMVATDKSTLKGTTAATSVPKVAAMPDETGYPAKGEDKRHPVEEPSKKDADPHVVGKPDAPAVTTEPLPVFSPDQVAELLHFYETPEVQAAIDMHGKVINNPQSFEQARKNVASFTKQFGDKLTLMQIAKLPLLNIIEYVKHDQGAAARIMYLLALELIAADQMLNSLTEPHTKKQEEKPAEVKQPEHKQVAAGGRKSRVASMD